LCVGSEERINHEFQPSDEPVKLDSEASNLIDMLMGRKKLEEPKEEGKGYFRGDDKAKKEVFRVSLVVVYLLSRSSLFFLSPALHPALRVPFSPSMY
jgi:hypothetical protein